MLIQHAPEKELTQKNFKKTRKYCITR